ncbi:MAG: methyl-accepting chemotaxis protein [Lachnospiraceae bacterium]|nr:methyl-accepting chemotaxis protein [Lachnospiraceae bacterium]
MKLVKKYKSLFTSGSLAKKTSCSIGTGIIIGMLVLVIASASLSGSFLTSSINGEFSGIASKNGAMIQSILDTASESAASLQDYIENEYEDYAKNGYVGATEKSALYDVQLQRMNKEIENYILNTAWSTVGNSEDISGIGVFFEQDAFDPSIKDYTIYVSNDDAKNKTCQSYGEYANYSSKDYYKEAAESQKMCFTDPYEDQGNKMVTASYPIVYDGKLQGVIVVDINIDNFAKIQTTDSKYPTMYVDILTNDSTFVYDSESDEYVGQKLNELLDSSQYSKIQKGIDTGKSFSVSTKKDDGSSVSRYYTPITAGEDTWWAASALDKKDLTKNTVKLVLIMVILSIVIVVVIVILVSKLLRKYIKPIEKVVDASSQLRNGDFAIEVKAESDDEIGTLSEAFSEAAGTLRGIIQDLKDVLQQMADNDFAISPNVDYPGDFESIRDSLFAVVADLSNTLSEINVVSEQVAANAENISQGAQSLTEGATDQASSVEELQATISNVSEEVERNAENAKSANEMAKNVGDEITETNVSMQQVVEAMELINSTSMQINSIINSIDDIASQTNLLALNASIEAARAGEAGKGFAVVATQVGELATQSAEAAKGSTELIANTIQAVEHGKTLVDVAAEKLIAAAGKTKELVDNIGAITVASENQASALSQLLLAADQIAAVVQENTAMAEESSASSEELAAQAMKLKELIEVFKFYEN